MLINFRFMFNVVTFKNSYFNSTRILLIQGVHKMLAHLHVFFIDFYTLSAQQVPCTDADNWHTVFNCIP